MSELYLGNQLITPVVMKTVIGEGVSDYEDLDNKPTINDVELVGNKTLDELGVQPKGDYALKEEIPSIEGLVTEQQLTQGLNEKQDKGNYALVEDIPTLVSELENDSNYATQTQVLQAIASIPQFKLSIVDELPSAGEKMTLYLVPKEGTNNDVYDEYIWIEQTTSFEHLGTTAVDLTDYVKNTDYATYKKAGVFKVENGIAITQQGYISGVTVTLENYKTKPNYWIVSKGTLETALTQYSKTVLTTEADYNALETKDANTLYLIEE